MIRNDTEYYNALTQVSKIVNKGSENQTWEDNAIMNDLMEAIVDYERRNYPRKVIRRVAKSFENPDFN